MLTLFLDLIDSPEEKDRFTYVYNTYNSYLYHYIMRMVRNEYTAQDILQDVFLRIAKNIYRIDISNEIKLKEYLRIIAHNRALTYITKQNDRIKHEIPLDYNSFNNCNDMQKNINIDNIVNNISMEHAVTIIRTLKRDYRDILVLRYVYEKHLSEIAEIFDSTPNEIRKKIMRAEKKLTKLLSRENIDF